jgi:hypothetical protein
MSTKTNFIFSVYGNGELTIRQRKFSERIYKINRFQIVTYDGFTSWSQPCSFEFKSKGVLLIKEFTPYVDETIQADYAVIKQCIDKKQFSNIENKFTPMFCQDSTGFLRIAIKLVNKHPL